jgi:hypothetical protein
VGGADTAAQLAQACELEAKLADEYRHVRLLRATIAGEASAHGEHAREAGRQARECINADFNVDNPHMPPRVSQKLFAAATLLRVMPEPSTPKARNLHREAQALIEQGPYSRPRAPCPAYAISPMRRETTTRRTRRRPPTQAVQRDSRQTKAGHQSGSGSLTRAVDPTTTTLTMS